MHVCSLCSFLPLTRLRASSLPRLSSLLSPREHPPCWLFSDHSCSTKGNQTIHKVEQKYMYICIYLFLYIWKRRGDGSSAKSLLLVPNRSRRLPTMRILAHLFNRLRLLVLLPLPVWLHNRASLDA
jgi:hypothetical protein